MRSFLLFLFFVISFSAWGQVTSLSGEVIDKKSGESLPFATVKTNTETTVLTDMDGKFSIHTKQPFSNITISYVGYRDKTIFVKKHFVKVKMMTSVEKLKEVIITATKNPARLLLEKVVAYKHKNNVEKALHSFKFNSYNKIVVTAHPDSIQPTIDSVFVKKNGKKIFVELDSTNYEFHKELKDKHLYIAEKISEIKFKKGKKRKEVVLASRMAGFKNPIYEALALTLQDFSVYDKEYTVVGTKYLNPASKKGLKFYRYKILDTITKFNRNLTAVYFKPKKKREKAFLEGVLYIDNANYAIAKTLYELKGFIHIKASQDFVFYQDKDVWFPSTQVLFIKKGKNKAGISLFGGGLQVSFQKEKDSIISPKRKNPSDVSYFISKTYNSDIMLNRPVKLKNSSMTMDFSEATNKEPAFWNRFRKDSLGTRDKNAYVYVDSIAEKEGVYQKVYLARKLLSGYYPTKYVDIDLLRFADYNKYEGFRVGFGGVTNNAVSKWFRFSSYVAYGFKDHTWKHQHKIAVLLNKKKNTWLTGAYTNDLKEAGLFAFENQKKSLFVPDLSTINVSHFFNHKTFSAQLKYDIQPNLEMTAGIKLSNEKSLFPYRFEGENEFKIKRWQLHFSYSPFNEYMLTPLGKTTVKNRYPKLLISGEKAFDDFSFLKINAQLIHKLQWNSKNSTYAVIQGGWVQGKAPITHLYSSNPNYNFNSPWINRISFEGRTRFETMAWGEFFSDTFIAFHLKHSLHPKFSLITRGVWGTISDTQRHQNIAFKNLEKGYFESGFSSKSLFYGFGLSCFYRYGHYQNPQWYDNLSVKLTYHFRLGF